MRRDLVNLNVLNAATVASVLFAQVDPSFWVRHVAAVNDFLTNLGAADNDPLALGGDAVGTIASPTASVEKPRVRVVPVEKKLDSTGIFTAPELVLRGRERGRDEAGLNSVCAFTRRPLLCS